MLTAPCRESTTYISISLSNTSVSHSKPTPGDDKRDKLSKAKTLVHKYLAFHKRAHILNCTICGSQRRRLFLVHIDTNKDVLPKARKRLWRRTCKFLSFLPALNSPPSVTAFTYYQSELVDRKSTKSA